MNAMKAQLPRKFLSIRDKNGSHRRSKSLEPGHKSRPLSADAFFALFRTEAAKQAAREEAEREKEAIKIEEIARRLGEMNITDVTHENIRYALTSKFASGDVDKAMEMLDLQRKSFAGTILPYDPNVKMLGAENRGNVTCYLDALLFAMFAKLEAFECMLKNEFATDAQRQLAALIRLWVNMLRSGKLIQVNMTKHIQDALAQCGWREAQLLEQQDTSEAFAFITETLQLPLLTLQVDLFHQGKNDVDDHKVVYERLLNLAVPPDPEGKGIKLEDCLEEYFNSKVDVLRDSLEEKKTVAERSSMTQKSTIRLVTEFDDAESSEHVETLSPLPMTPSQSSRTLPDHAPESTSSISLTDRPAPRHRSTSIIQRIVLDDEGRPTEADGDSVLQRARRKGSTIVKAVTIPAWQFFRLIPWHATSDSEPKNDSDVARQFNQRPVLGICLKRYMMTKNGLPKRQNTFIDIPESLRLPHFMMLDEKPQELANGLSTEYKLVLQSVVCHRGESLHSGHYIAFCRIAPKLMTDNRRHDSDPPPDYEEAQWVKFDDLLLENRVSHVEDIKQALKAEMPYLLFYQIVPMVDVTATSDVSEAEPPSYQDVTINASVSEPVADADRSHASTRRNSGYFDVAAPDGPASTGPDVRLSPDIDHPSRTSLAVDDDSSYALAASQSNNTQGTTNTGASDDAFRRGSVGLSETTGVTTPANTPDPVPNVPSGTPGAGGDESTAQRLSRAASRFTKTPSAGGAAGSSGSRSRPESQTGEGRISLTSRLGGLMRSSREPLRDATPGNGSQAPNAPTLGESVVVDDTVPAVPLIPPDAESMPAKNLDPAIGGAVPGATTPTTPGSGHHNHHHHHSHSHKKDKGKGKEKEKTFKLNKQGLPERECTVM